jgi:Protein of unknown function with HXXEE motif
MESKDNENMIFWALLGASCAHVVEEYFWPGGFLEAAKEVAPEQFENAPMPIIVGVNASMILGCLNGALLRKRFPPFGLTMASLLFANAIIHTLGTIRMKKYMPGLVTGLVLYVPLSVKAFSDYKKSPRYSRFMAVGSAGLGAALNAIPFIAFAIRKNLAGKAEGSLEEGQA